MFPIVGNHEIDGGQMNWMRAEYDNGNGERTPLKEYTNQDGPVGIKQTQYTWDWGAIRFVNVNVYANDAQDDDDFTLNGVITDGGLAWCEKAFKQARDMGQQIIVMSHEPCWDPDWSRKHNDCLGRSGAYVNRNKFWRLMEDYGVLAYMCGDSHVWKTFIPAEVVNDTGDFPTDPGDDVNFPPNLTRHIDFGNWGNYQTQDENYTWGRGSVYPDKIVFTIRRAAAPAGTSWGPAEDDNPSQLGSPLYSAATITLPFRDANPSVYIPSPSVPESSSSSSSSSLFSSSSSSSSSQSSSSSSSSSQSSSSSSSSSSQSSSSSSSSLSSSSSSSSSSQSSSSSSSSLSSSSSSSSL